MSKIRHSTIAKGLLLTATILTSGFAIGLSETQREVPAFELSGVEGELWDQDALDGKLWIINFWATWCPPCIEEIPSMNTAWAAVKDEGIGMLAINAGEDSNTVKQFLARVPIDFPVVLGNGDTLPNWSVRALPTTIVVNAEGQVVLQALGPRDWADDELLDQVRALQQQPSKEEQSSEEVQPCEDVQ